MLLLMLLCSITSAAPSRHKRQAVGSSSEGNSNSVESDGGDSSRIAVAAQPQNTRTMTTAECDVS